MNTALQTLIHTIQNHTTEWYRVLWGGETEFSSLPLLHQKDFIDTPLSKRRYKDEKSLVKIVHTPQGPFLSEWSFADIAKEEWGVLSERPFVYLSDPHGAIEKSMWCYEQNRVPLIGEKNPDIATVAAKKYQIDSLIADPLSIAKLLPFLESRTEKLAAITLVAEVFSPQELLHLSKYADVVRLVLAFSETGVLGIAQLSNAPMFILPANCFVENVSDGLVFTKTTQYVTPIIRYASGISGEVSEGGRAFTVKTYA